MTRELLRQHARVREYDRAEEEERDLELPAWPGKRAITSELETSASAQRDHDLDRLHATFAGMTADGAGMTADGAGTTTDGAAQPTLPAPPAPTLGGLLGAATLTGGRPLAVDAGALDAKLREALEQRADSGAKARYAEAVAGADTLRDYVLSYSFPDVAQTKAQAKQPDGKPATAATATATANDAKPAANVATPAATSAKPAAPGAKPAANDAKPASDPAQAAQPAQKPAAQPPQQPPAAQAPKTPVDERRALDVPAKPADAAAPALQIWPSQLERFERAKQQVSETRRRAEQQYETMKGAGDDAIVPALDAKLAATRQQRGAQRDPAGAPQHDRDRDRDLPAPDPKAKPTPAHTQAEAMKQARALEETEQQLARAIARGTAYLEAAKPAVQRELEVQLGAQQAAPAAAKPAIAPVEPKRTEAKQPAAKPIEARPPVDAKQPVGAKQPAGAKQPDKADKTADKAVDKTTDKAADKADKTADKPKDETGAEAQRLIDEQRKPDEKKLQEHAHAEDLFRSDLAQITTRRPDELRALVPAQALDRRDHARIRHELSLDPQHLARRLGQDATERPSLLPYARADLGHEPGEAKLPAAATPATPTTGPAAPAKARLGALTPSADAPAPAPKARGTGTGGGFAKPAKPPQLPPPPQSANQAAINAYIDQARKDREAARAKVGAQQLAKCAQVSVDANTVPAAAKQKQDAELAKLRAAAEKEKQDAAKKAAEQKQQEGPVTLESLKEKLETKAAEEKQELKSTFERKQAELKIKLETKKATLEAETKKQIDNLKEQDKKKQAEAEAAWKTKQAELEKARDGLVVKLREQVKADRIRLEKDKEKLFAKANERKAQLERDRDRDVAKAQQTGDKNAADIEAKGHALATAKRQEGQAKASQLRSAALAKADAATDEAEKTRLKNEAEAQAGAEIGKLNKIADDLDVKAKLDAKAVRADAEKQVNALKDACTKAIGDAKATADKQVAAIDEKVNSLGPLIDQKIKKAEDDLKKQLDEGHKKVAEQLKGSEQKIKQLEQEGAEKLKKLEADTGKDLQKDYDAQVKAIDARVDAARKKLAAGKEKDVKALEKMVEQTIQAVDKTVADAEKKFDTRIADAEKKAQAVIVEQLRKIKAEADRALQTIDKAFADAMKRLDDAVLATHKQMEELAQGKMLELEVHTATLLGDLGEGTRLEAVKQQLAEYIKRGQKIPAGYGQTATPEPPSTAAKKDDKPGDKKDDKDKKDAKADEKKDAAKPDPDAEAQAKLLDPKNLSPEGIEAKVQQQLKEGQKATSVGATDGAQRAMEDARKATAAGMQKFYDGKAADLDKIKDGDPEAIKALGEQADKQRKSEEAGRKAAEDLKTSTQRKNWYGGTKDPDPKEVLKTLEGADAAQIEAMRAALAKDGIDLDELVKKHMDSAGELEEARVRLGGDPVMGDILALKNSSGHELTNNQKLLIGSTGLAGLAFVAINGDSNLGADQDRIREVLERRKNDPEFIKKFEEVYGRPIGDFLARTGTGDQAEALGLPKPQVESRTKEEIQKQASADAEKLLADPKNGGKIDPKKVGPKTANMIEALGGFHLDGTRGDMVRDNLKDLSPEELAYLKADYKARTGRDLDRDLEKQLSGAALVESKATLRGDKTTATVNKILGAEEGSLTPWTVDDKKLQDALRDLKDPAERRAVLEAYKARTGRDLAEVITEKMTGNDEKLALALAEGDTLKAQMVELDEAAHGGFLNGLHGAIAERTGLPTEQLTRAIVNGAIGPLAMTAGLYSSITGDKLVIGGFEIENGSIHKVDSDKIFEILEQNPNPADRERLRALYKAKTGKDLDDDMKHSLGGGATGLDDNKYQAYQAIMEGRTADYHAHRMDDAVFGLNDTKALHKQLEGKSEWERKAIIDAYNAKHGGDPQAFAKMMNAQTSGLDKEKLELLATTKDDAKTGVVKLPDEFVLRYAQDSVWNRTAKFIDENTKIFDKYPFLYAIPIVGTTAMNAKTAAYFMRGWGVDNDAIKETLKGKSKEELEELKKKYPGLEQDLMYALSGRDAFEVKLMLEEGEPKTPEEKIRRQLRLYEFDRGSAGAWIPGGEKLSNAIVDLVSPSGGLMDMEAKQLRDQLAVLQSGGQLTPEQQQRLDVSLAVMNQASTNFIAAREEVTGAIATAVGAVVGAVVTVLTGGVAGAVLAALATGLSTVAVKVAMLGQSYGRNEMGVDLAMMAVQMATAGIGAGVGAKSFLGQVLTGAIGNAASSFVQTAITSKDAHDLLGLLAQASKAGIVGFMSGAASSAATFALGKAMEKLSLKAFGQNLFGEGASVGATFFKGFVTGAGSSVASMFVEAAANPEMLSGNWDAIFAQVLRTTVEGGLTNAISEGAEAYGDQRRAAKQTLRDATDAAKAVKAGGGSLEEQQRAFAEVMSRGMDREAAATTAPAPEREAPPKTPDEIEQRLQKQPAPAEGDAPAAPVPDAPAPAAAPAGKPTVHADDVRQQMADVAGGKHDPSDPTRPRPDHDAPAAAPAGEPPGKQATDAAPGKQATDAAPGKQTADATPAEAPAPRGKQIAADAPAENQLTGKTRAEAQELLYGILDDAPSVGNKYPEPANRFSSPAELEAALRKNGVTDPHAIAAAMERSRFVFPGNEGQVRRYEGPGLESNRHFGETPTSPIIRVATGESAIVTVRPGQDPKLVSTDYAGCGATIIHGVDKDGNKVILLGHVFQQDTQGHLARVHEDLALMRALGVTDLEVTLVPGKSDHGPQIGSASELGQHLGPDVGVRVIDKGGEDKHTHVLVDKDGAAVFEGPLKKNRLPEVLATHAFGDGPNPRGKQMSAEMDDFGSSLSDEVGLDPSRAPKDGSWKRPDDGAERSHEGGELLARIDGRKQQLLEADPSLSPREAERRARSELLHEISDAEAGPVARAAQGFRDALRTGDGATAVESLGGIQDLSQRRALIQELRRANDNAPLPEILAKLPPEHRAQVEAHLAALRANPEQVAHAEERLAAQREAHDRFQRARAAGDPAAELAAQQEWARTRQAALDAIVDAYGIDDSQVTQRKPTDAMGYGLERGSIGTSPYGGDSVAEALPDGRVIAKNEGRALFVDPRTGEPRSAAFIAAALGHEIEAHVEQLRGGRYSKIAPGGQVDIGTAINEAEAYGYMLREADRFGLSPEERAWVRGRLDAELARLAAHDPEAHRRVLAGDFGVPGHAVEHAPLAPWRPHGGEDPAAAPTAAADATGKRIALALDQISDAAQRTRAEGLLDGADRLDQQDPALAARVKDVAVRESASPEAAHALARLIDDAAEGPEGARALRESLDRLEIARRQELRIADRQAVESAQQKLARGEPLSSGETVALLDLAVGIARHGLIAEMHGVLDARQALAAENLGGMCGPSQGRVANVLEAILVGHGGEVIRHSTSPDADVTDPSSKLIGDAPHFFTVVKMPDGQMFLLDPTFGQFLQADPEAGRVGTRLLGDPDGARIAGALAGDGYVALTPEVARAYGAAMTGRPGAEHSLDDFTHGGALVDHRARVKRNGPSDEQFAHAEAELGKLATPRSAAGDSAAHAPPAQAPAHGLTTADEATLDAVMPRAQRDAMLAAPEVGAAGLRVLAEAARHPNLKGLTDWLAFEGQQTDPTHWKRALAEIREALRLLDEDPTRTVQVGGDVDPPRLTGKHSVDPRTGVTDQDRAPTFDVTVCDASGNALRSVEMTSIAQPAKGPNDFTDAINHAGVKARRRAREAVDMPDGSSAGTPVPIPGARDAVIQMAFFHGEVCEGPGATGEHPATFPKGSLPPTAHQPGTRSTIHDGMGNFQFQQYDPHRGETIPTKGRAGPNPGNVIDNLVKQLNSGKPPSAAELDRIRLVDESGTVIAELRKDASGVWSR